MADLPPLRSGSKLEQEAEVHAVVAQLPPPARVAVPWLVEAHNLLAGKVGSENASLEERRVLARYCATFAARKIGSVKTADAGVRQQCQNLAAWITEAAAVLGPATSPRLRHGNRPLSRTAPEGGGGDTPMETDHDASYTLANVLRQEAEANPPSPTHARDLSNASGANPETRAVSPVSTVSTGSYGERARGPPPTLAVDPNLDPDDPASDPANSILAMAQKYLAAAEAAAEAGKREKASLEFHSVFVYLEVVRAVRGGLDDATEQVQEYALWRSHESAHLRENSVHEHGGAASERTSGNRLQDRYEIHVDDVLGQGSFGAVRVGQRRNGNGNRVAVKTIATAGMPAKKIRKLHEEVSILRAADHPHIVQLLEVFYSPRGRVHLVMELCAGGTLYDYLDQFPDQHTDERRGAGILRQMLSAVRYLHDHGIVHCDIKLENWLCEVKRTPEEDPPALKLIDFGLSRHIDPDRRPIHEACGTIFYVAPEVLTDASGAGFGEECDLWSTGVVAYMMLSGSPPFYGNTNGETKEQVLRGNPSYSTRLFRHCGGGKRGLAVQFIRGLLVVDPAGRLTAADALVHPWLMEMGASRPEIVAPLPEEAGHPSLAEVSDDLSAASSATDTRNSNSNVLTRRELVQSLRGFTELSNLSKLVCEVAAMTLRPDEIAELRSTFEAIDVDGSGTISYEELRNALVGNGSPPEDDGDEKEMDIELSAQRRARRVTLPEEDINKIFDGISVSHDKQGVSYHEFLAAVMWRRVDLDEDRLFEVFETLDVHGTGKLKLSDVAETCGQDFKPDVIDGIVKEFDNDHDGFVTYRDLVTAWRTHVKQEHVAPLIALASPRSAARAELMR